MKADKLYLVGFMGAGKTSVARALGRRMGWRVEDVDHRIEACEHQRVAEIFATQGESYFRSVERSVLQGRKLMDGINALKAKHEVLMEARGKGCMIGIEFQEPKSLKLKMAWKMIHAAHDGLFAQMVVMPLLQKHRILTQVSGNHGDIIRILPAFVISDETVAELFGKGVLGIRPAGAQKAQSR